LKKKIEFSLDLDNKIMSTISIKYGDTQYELNIKYIAYLINNITITDEQIKKDMNEIINDRNMKLTLLHIAVILNNIDLVKKLIELNHPLYDIKQNILSPLAIVFENKNNNISFEIAKLIIEKDKSALYYGTFDKFYSKKQNAEDWIYITEKIFIDFINESYSNYEKVLLSYSFIDNIEEGDAAYKLIYNLLKNYVNNGIALYDNTFMNDALKRIYWRIIHDNRKNNSYKLEKLEKENAELKSKIDNLKKILDI